MGLAYTILRSREMAQDEVQNAFFQLARSNCPEIANREAWLVTVCRNGALKTLKRSRRSTPLTDGIENAVPDPQFDVRDVLTQTEGATSLLALLDSLPEKRKEVLQLHYVSGLKLREIASILGVAANTIYQRHFEALVSLKQKLGATPRPAS